MCRHYLLAPNISKTEDHPKPQAKRRDGSLISNLFEVLCNFTAPDGISWCMPSHFKI